MLNYIYWITLGHSTDSSDAHITRLPELSPRKAACGWLLSVSCVTFSRTMNILPCEWASGCWGPTAAHRCPVQTPPVGQLFWTWFVYLMLFRLPDGVSRHVTPWLHVQYISSQSSWLRANITRCLRHPQGIFVSFPGTSVGTLCLSELVLENSWENYSQFCWRAQHTSAVFPSAHPLVPTGAYWWPHALGSPLSLVSVSWRSCGHASWHEAISPFRVLFHPLHCPLPSSRPVALPTTRVRSRHDLRVKCGPHIQCLADCFESTDHLLQQPSASPTAHSTLTRFCVSVFNVSCMLTTPRSLFHVCEVPTSTLHPPVVQI